VHSVSPPLAYASASVPEELGEVMLDLQVLRVADVGVTQLDLSLLDDAERRRADALASPADRVRYVAAHVVLRRLLGGHLGLAPRAVVYVREPCPRCGAPHGRPAVGGPTPPLHFSLSYSGGLGLIGIASAPVGVDVEMLAPPETVDEVSALLHPAERAEIASAPPAQRSAVFTRIWTRKEAYLKGTGTGVALDLAADYLGTEERATGPVGWAVTTVPIPFGYGAAVAVRG
jgi:4'-phosphopantetheinyl transferase